MASSQLRTLSSPPRLKSFSACAARFLIVLIMFKLAYSFDRSNPFGQMVWRYGIQRARSWLVSDRCVQKPRVNRDTMRFGSVVPIGPLAIVLGRGWRFRGRARKLAGDHRRRRAGTR